MRPNAYITSLLKATNNTIAKFAKYKPETIEEVIAIGQKKADKYNSTQRSLKFFVQEYTGSDKENMIAQVEAELIKCQQELALTPSVTSLAVLNQADEKATAKALMLLINDLRLYFQVDNMISTEGIISLCPMIIAEYPGLSLEEITVCFAQAKKGHYGELFNRLDGYTIFKWLKAYSEAKIERAKLRQENEYRKHKFTEPKERAPSKSELLNVANAAVGIARAKGI